MGAQETGPFDNDDAADFVGELNELQTESEVVAALETACREMLVDGYLELPTVAVGVAAAALLAIRAGAPSPDVLQRVFQISQVLAQSPAVLTADLQLLASSALSRALEEEDNEWFELWADADLLDEVAAAMAPYQEAVAA